MYVIRLIIVQLKGCSHLIPGNCFRRLLSFKSVLQPNLLLLLLFPLLSSSTLSTTPPLIHHQSDSVRLWPSCCSANSGQTSPRFSEPPQSPAAIYSKSCVCARRLPWNAQKSASGGRHGDPCRCPRRPTTMGYFRPTVPRSLSVRLSVLFTLFSLATINHPPAWVWKKNKQKNNQEHCAGHKGQFLEWWQQLCNFSKNTPLSSAGDFFAPTWLHQLTKVSTQRSPPVTSATLSDGETSTPTIRT